MDQLPVEIKIDDYWNPELHALLIFCNYTSPILLFTMYVQDWRGHFHTEMFPWCILKMCMKKFDAEKIFFDKLTGFLT